MGKGVGNSCPFSDFNDEFERSGTIVLGYGNDRI
jgi:hypothetical protein